MFNEFVSIDEIFLHLYTQGGEETAKYRIHCAVYDYER